MEVQWPVSGAKTYSKNCPILTVPYEPEKHLVEVTKPEKEKFQAHQTSTNCDQDVTPNDNTKIDADISAIDNVTLEDGLFEDTFDKVARGAYATSPKSKGQINSKPVPTSEDNLFELSFHEPQPIERFSIQTEIKEAIKYEGVAVQKDKKVNQRTLRPRPKRVESVYVQPERKKRAKPDDDNDDNLAQHIKKKPANDRRDIDDLSEASFPLKGLTIPVKKCDKNAKGENLSYLKLNHEESYASSTPLGKGLNRCIQKINNISPIIGKTFNKTLIKDSNYNQVTNENLEIINNSIDKFCCPIYEVKCIAKKNPLLEKHLITNPKGKISARLVESGLKERTIDQEIEHFLELRTTSYQNSHSNHQNCSVSLNYSPVSELAITKFPYRQTHNWPQRNFENYDYSESPNRSEQLCQEIMDSPVFDYESGSKKRDILTDVSNSFDAPLSKSLNESSYFPHSWTNDYNSTCEYFNEEKGASSDKENSTGQESSNIYGSFPIPSSVINTENLDINREKINFNTEDKPVNGFTSSENEGTRRESIQKFQSKIGQKTYGSIDTSCESNSTLERTSIQNSEKINENRGNDNEEDDTGKCIKMNDCRENNIASTETAENISDTIEGAENATHKNIHPNSVVILDPSNHQSHKNSQQKKVEDFKETSHLNSEKILEDVNINNDGQNTCDGEGSSNALENNKPKYTMFPSELCNKRGNVTVHRNRYHQWGKVLDTIGENESIENQVDGKTDNNKEPSQSQANDENDEDLQKCNDLESKNNDLLNEKQSRDSTGTIFLKPGKSWARSLSILYTIKDGKSNINELANNRGKHWRHSVQDVINMQTEGFKIQDQNHVEGTPNRENFQVESLNNLLRSPCKSRASSMRIVPMESKKTIQECLDESNNSEDDSKRISNLPRRITMYTEDELINSAKTIVLKRCNQTSHLPFKSVFTNSYLNYCKKIGEGVYGEVFLYQKEGEEKSVIKIIPIEGSSLVNNEPQKKFSEILSEIIIAEELHKLRNGVAYKTGGFVGVKRIKLIKGKYPAKLIEIWNQYDAENNSDNDCPTMFNNSQLYIALELNHGGNDLEGFDFQTAIEAYSIFLQTALALAVAERCLEFEHRDLHWGNILISQTNERFIKYKLENCEIKLATKGVKVSVIDFTLSRLSYRKCRIFNDLSTDPTLFAAQGEYQFDIYRMMRDLLDNDWQQYNPRTNVFWLHYILDKMIRSCNYKRTKRQIHKTAIEKLNDLENEMLKYDSAFDFITKCENISEEIMGIEELRSETCND